MGEHVLHGPGIGHRGGLHLRREQTGGQIGDVQRRSSKQGQNLLRGEDVLGRATASFPGPKGDELDTQSSITRCSPRDAPWTH